MSDTLTPFLQETADAYGRLSHTPAEPRTRYAYRRLTAELWQQFTALKLVIRFTNVDPYETAAQLFDDVSNGFLSVYRYADLPAGHPLAIAAPNGETFNSIFRAVHDAIGHYGIGLAEPTYDFTPLGEFHAYRRHARTLSLPACYAVATETLGQNAYLHFGPTSGQFATQKAGILPLSLITRSLALEV